MAGKGTSEAVDKTVEGVVDAVKSVADTVSHTVEEVGETVKDTAEDIKPSVVGVVDAVKDTVQDAKPSVVGVVDAVKDTVQDAKPSVVEAVKGAAQEVRPVVRNVADSVKDAVEDVKPSVKDAASSVKGAAQDVKSSVQDVGGSLKSAAEDVKSSGNQTFTPSDNQNVKLYEERLVADMKQVKTGEVGIGKRVETQTAHVSVPVENERVVVERTIPVDAGTPVVPGEADFHEGKLLGWKFMERLLTFRSKPLCVKKSMFVKKWNTVLLKSKIKSVGKS